MNPLAQQIVDFADANFKRDLPSRLKKLGEEFGELAEAIAKGDQVSARLEVADCAIVLTDIAHLLKSDLDYLMQHKWSVVMERARNGTLPKGERQP
jgi:NTP pyrophosphatase (non-canonical NTP hydrolase)